MSNSTETENKNYNMVKSATPATKIEIKTSTASKMYDGEYFDIMATENDILIVRCNICGPDGPLLRTSTKSNGNILKHIKRRHINMLAKIKDEKSVKSRSPRVAKRIKSGAFVIKSEKRENKSNSSFSMNDIDSVDHFIDEVDDSYHANSSHEQMVIIAPDENNDTNENNDQDNDIFVSILPIEHEAESDPDDYEDIEGDHEKLDDRSTDLMEESDLASAPPFDNTPPRNISNRIAGKISSKVGDISSANSHTHSVDHAIIEFQKKLLQSEYDEIRIMREEKHQLELEILKAELAHKTVEHQKRMEILNKKLRET